MHSGQDEWVSDEAGLGDSPFSVTLALAADAGAPAQARQYVAAHAQGVPVDVTNDAILLVSELVTNAVEHGRPNISLSLSLHPPGLGVAVRDHGATFPVPAPRTPEPTMSRGRGLMIVEALSSSWGIEPHNPPPGKVVWFEMDAASVADPNG